VVGAVAERGQLQQERRQHGVVIARRLVRPCRENLFVYHSNLLDARGTRRDE
jgi:hypothetical protein